MAGGPGSINAEMATDTVIYLVPNDRQPQCGTPWLIEPYEVLFQTGVVLGLMVVRQSLCLRSKVLRVASSCAAAGGGMDVVVAARPHGANVSHVTSNELLM